MPALACSSSRRCFSATLRSSPAARHWQPSDIGAASKGSKVGRQGDLEPVYSTMKLPAGMPSSARTPQPRSPVWNTARQGRGRRWKGLYREFNSASEPEHCLRDSICESAGSHTCWCTASRRGRSWRHSGQRIAGSHSQARSPSFLAPVL